MLPVGIVLHNTYRIEEQLASGGFGNTYRATNIVFEETVAIKEFYIKDDCQRGADQTSVSVSHPDKKEVFESQKEKFKKEAKRLRSFDDAGIIRVHDLFEENGTAYYVMDFIDGESLKDRLGRTGEPMHEQEVLPLFVDVLKALRTVHASRLLHLDLKPGNIMVDKDGGIKLIDFGSSKQLNEDKDGATALTAQTKTDRFSPREQMEENFKKYGPWTDIYALGATLYSVLTNSRPPLPSDIDDDESDDKHLALPFPDNVSDTMRRTIIWMMATDRTKRPQSVDELLNSFSTDFNQDDSGYDDVEEDKVVEETETIEEDEMSEDVSEDVVEETVTIEEPNHITEKADNVTYGVKSHVTAFEAQHNKKDNDRGTWTLLQVFLITLICAFLSFFVFRACSQQSSEQQLLSENELSVDYYPLGHGIYEGDWTNGEPDGSGTIKYDCGYTFKGEFKEGKAHGHGVLTSPTGSIIYDGQYEDGERTSGTQYFDDGKAFIGKFYIGYPQDGTLKSASGEVLYKGTFYLDMSYDTGYGKETGAAYEYVGNFKNGQYHGKGKYTWTKETRANWICMYDGDWVYGHRTGHGTAYFVNHTYEQGVFKNDELITITQRGTWK